MSNRMAVFPVVLDSCVLFPALIRDTLLRAAEAGLYRVHWSQQILDDTALNLVKRGKVRTEQAERLIEAMSDAFPDAMVEVPPALIEAMTNDAGDRHVVAAAVISHAPVIVTLNLKHFQENDLQPWGVEAQSPDVFLTHLYDLAPSEIINLIYSQASERQTPLTVIELLERLKKIVPQFVSKISSHQ